MQVNEAVAFTYLLFFTAQTNDVKVLGLRADQHRLEMEKKQLLSVVDMQRETISSLAFKLLAEAALSNARREELIKLDIVYNECLEEIIEEYERDKDVCIRDG